jgi:hypothetical protein
MGPLCGEMDRFWQQARSLARALPLKLVDQRGPFWVPIMGPIPTPIDTSHFKLLCSQLRRGCCPSVTNTEASVCGIVQYDKRTLHSRQTEEFRLQSGVSQKGLKTRYCR